MSEKPKGMFGGDTPAERWRKEFVEQNRKIRDEDISGPRTSSRVNINLLRMNSRKEDDTVAYRRRVDHTAN